MDERCLNSVSLFRKDVDSRPDFQDAKFEEQALRVQELEKQTEDLYKQLALERSSSAIAPPPARLDTEDYERDIDS